MTDRDGFLAWVGSELRDAEVAMHNGDATPRRAIWSDEEPVSVFGAWKDALGRPQIEALFDQLETKFSDCTSSSFEILAADVVGEMAYTAGHEHTRVTVDGEQRTYTLRVTQVYRYEDQRWRVVHRHADEVPEDT